MKQKRATHRQKDGQAIVNVCVTVRLRELASPLLSFALAVQHRLAVSPFPYTQVRTGHPVPHSC